MSASGPNGRFADSGGIFVEGGTLTISTTSISTNSASLAASLPDSVDLAALVGGIHVGGDVTAAIRTTLISGNSVSMTNTNPAGYANAWSGGLHTDADITASGVIVTNNTVTASAPEFAVGDSGAGEMEGTFTGVIMSGNSVSVSSAQRLGGRPCRRLDLSAVP